MPRNPLAHTELMEVSGQFRLVRVPTKHELRKMNSEMRKFLKKRKEK